LNERNNGILLSGTLHTSELALTKLASLLQVFKITTVSFVAQLTAISGLTDKRPPKLLLGLRRKHFQFHAGASAVLMAVPNSHIQARYRTSTTSK
jgi:hypothetical protein